MGEEEGAVNIGDSSSHHACAAPCGAALPATRVSKYGSDLQSSLLKGH